MDLFKNWQQIGSAPPEKFGRFKFLPNVQILHYRVAYFCPTLKVALVTSENETRDFGLSRLNIKVLPLDTPGLESVLSKHYGSQPVLERQRRIKRAIESVKPAPPSSVIESFSYRPISQADVIEALRRYLQELAPVL